MKTGFDFNDSTLSDRITETGTHLLNKLLEHAIVNACAYSKSAGRDNLSGQDIIIALQYEAHEFINRQNSSIPQENTDDTDSDTDSDTESVNENDPEDDVFTRSESNDPLIVLMNYYHDNWDSWNPELPIEISLKNAVDSAIKYYT